MNFNYFIFALLLSTLMFQSCTKEDEEKETIGLAYDSTQFYEDNCAKLDELASTQNSNQINLIFSNEIDESVKIYWINFNGELTVYNSELKPGKTFQQHSYLTHHWYITKMNEDCISIVTCNVNGSNLEVKIVYE